MVGLRRVTQALVTRDMVDEELTLGRQLERPLSFFAFRFR